MTIRNSAWMNNVPVYGEDLRMMNASFLSSGSNLIGSSSGVIAALGGPLAVSGSGVSSVTINAGQAYIQGTSSGAQGAYLVTNDGSFVLSGFTDRTGTARTDAVVAQVQDSDYSGSGQNITFKVLTGSSSGPPATPANALLLATVAIPAGSGPPSIVTANITDARRYIVARGGVIPCTAATRPGSPYGGTTIYETDTNVLKTWNSNTSAWVPSYPAATVLSQSTNTGRKVIAGSFSITCTSGQAATALSTTFPDGGFSSTPAVVASISAFTGNTAMVINIGSVTATTFSWRASLANTASTAVFASTQTVTAQYIASNA